MWVYQRGDVWSSQLNLTSSMSPRGNRRTSMGNVFQAQWANSMANRGSSVSHQTGWRMFQKPWLLFLAQNSVFEWIIFGVLRPPKIPKFNMEPENDSWWFPKGISFSRAWFSGSGIHAPIFEKQIAKGDYINLVDCCVVTKWSPYATTKCLALLCSNSQMLMHNINAPFAIHRFMDDQQQEGKSSRFGTETKTHQPTIY